jgi:hypothetical protein
MFLSDREKLLMDSIIRTYLEHLNFDNLIENNLMKLLINNDWDDEKYQLYATYRIKLWMIERLSKDVMNFEVFEEVVEKGIRTNPIGFKY